LRSGINGVGCGSGDDLVRPPMCDRAPLRTSQLGQVVTVDGR
jgi:hypothetical protein